MSKTKNIKVDEELWYKLAKLKLKMRKAKLSDVIDELITKPNKSKPKSIKKPKKGGKKK